jgi:transposase InsO family protein
MTVTPEGNFFIPWPWPFSYWYETAGLLLARERKISDSISILLPVARTAAEVKQRVHAHHHGNDTMDNPGSHSGIIKTYKTVRNTVYAYNLMPAVKQEVQACNPCRQVNASPKKKVPHQPITTPRPFDKLLYDLEKRPKDLDTGAEYNLVVIDHFSKFVWSQPLLKKKAQPIALFLHRLFLREGAPASTLADNGKEFVGKVVKEILAAHTVKEQHGRSRHPQTQGAVERVHATLAAKATKYQVKHGIHRDRWEGAMEAAVAMYNRDAHEALSGLSPLQVPHSLLSFLLNPYWV